MDRRLWFRHPRVERRLPVQPHGRGHALPCSDRDERHGEQDLRRDRGLHRIPPGDRSEVAAGGDVMKLYVYDTERLEDELDDFTSATGVEHVRLGKEWSESNKVA